MAEAHYGIVYNIAAYVVQSGGVRLWRTISDSREDTTTIFESMTGRKLDPVMCHIVALYEPALVVTKEPPDDQQ